MTPQSKLWTNTPRQPPLDASEVKFQVDKAGGRSKMTTFELSRRQSVEVFKALASLQQFRSISPFKLTRLIESAVITTLPRRGTARFEGVFASSFHLLVQGTAKLRVLDEQKRQIGVAMLRAGKMFGACSSLLPQSIHSFECFGIRECILARFDPEQFLEVMLGTQLNDLANLAGATIAGVCEAIIRYSERATLTLRERLVRTLVELANEFGARDSRGTILTVPLTHDDIAQVVGASRQRTTMELNELTRAGAILRTGHQMVLVIPVLHNMIARHDEDGCVPVLDSARTHRPAKLGSKRPQSGNIDSIL